LAQGASDVLRDAGSAASSIMVAGSTGINDGPQSKRVLELFRSVDSKANTAKPKISRGVQNALRQGGAKGKTLFDAFKSSKFVGKLGGIMGKLQLKAPIHLIDSMITYAIGVVSGMQDMAQVSVFFWVEGDGWGRLGEVATLCVSWLAIYSPSQNITYVPLGSMRRTAYTSAFLRLMCSSCTRKRANVAMQ
jgi:hypothetical protein